MGRTKHRHIPDSGTQRVRATGRDESQSVPSPEKLLKTSDLELPFFEGSLPSCYPHSVGYTPTSLHPYFPGSPPERDQIVTPQLTFGLERWLSISEKLPLERQSLHTHTTFIVGELMLQLHTHISYTALIVKELICVMRVYLWCHKGNYTTIMLRELISNYTHTSYTSIIVGELIVYGSMTWRWSSRTGHSPGKGLKSTGNIEIESYYGVKSLQTQETQRGLEIHG